MNLVVGFLSMLNSDEENGGVRRMLGVCSEFERIAKVVLDKAEKETFSRRKRKGPEDKTKSAPLNQHGPPQTPMMNNGIPNNFSPGMNNPNFHQQHQPEFSPTSNGSPQSNWQPDIGNSNEYMSPNGMTPFAEIQNYPTSSGVGSPMAMGTFQQPFVPQDLFQMPMSLEWDWADMTGGQYPSFENGVVGDMGLQNVNTAHLRNQGGMM